MRLRTWETRNQGCRESLQSKSSRARETNAFFRWQVEESSIVGVADEWGTDRFCDLSKNPAQANPAWTGHPTDPASPGQSVSRILNRGKAPAKETRSGPASRRVLELTTKHPTLRGKRRGVEWGSREKSYWLAHIPNQGMSGVPMRLVVPRWNGTVDKLWFECGVC